MTAHPNLSPVAHSWLLLTVFPHCHQPCDFRVVCAVDWERYGCIQAVSPCGEQNKGPPLQKTGTGPVFCWLRGYTPWIEAETYVSIRSSWFHKSQCLWIWCTHKCFQSVCLVVRSETGSLYVWTFDDISVVVFVSYSPVTVAPYSSFTFICQVKSCCFSSSQNHKSPLESCQEVDPA